MSVLLLLDPGKNLAEALVLDDGSVTDPLQLVESRIGQSTLLLKGLEAETCVMLDVEKMNANHLYVAMTRGAKRLIIRNRGSMLVPAR